MLVRRHPASLHSVFERTFHEHRRSVFVWSASLFVLAVTMAALYPTVRDNPQLATLHETYPKALRSLFGITDLTTGVGFMRAERGHDEARVGVALRDLGLGDHP